MPAAQRVIQEAGLSPAQVPGTGPGGRVLKEDAQRAAGNIAGDAPREAGPGRSPERQQSVPVPGAPTAPRAVPPAPPAAVAPSRPAPSRDGGPREEEVVPMTLLRKRIAERLVSAQQTAALLTTFNEVDMSAVMALRKEHQEAFQKRYGVKLGFMSFFVKASIDALKQVPAVNAEIRGDAIAYHNYFDIGVAVGGGKGLVVPVLRNAERMSFAEVEIAIAEFAKRAQENRLKLEELSGGTFTISNGGVYGSLMSTPIVNPPQSGILGLHAIQDRPVALNGQVVIRPMMYVALTYDHRIVDGREAVTFLKRVKDVVENPARMLIEA
jgi:2-oxoglutarate dehydrogenase E2 component (dihydrolipoamide succinyltransferase)